MPENERSELVLPANFPCDGLRDTTRMFHVASAALNMPARSPTRGSGFGATVDMLYCGPPAQAAETIPTARDSKRMVIRFGIGRVPMSERTKGLLRAALEQFSGKQ